MSRQALRLFDGDGNVVGMAEAIDGKAKFQAPGPMTVVRLQRDGAYGADVIPPLDMREGDTVVFNFVAPDPRPVPLRACTRRLLRRAT